METVTLDCSFQFTSGLSSIVKRQHSEATKTLSIVFDIFPKIVISSCGQGFSSRGIVDSLSQRSCVAVEYERQIRWTMNFPSLCGTYEMII